MSHCEFLPQNETTVRRNQSLAEIYGQRGTQRRRLHCPSLCHRWRER